MLAKGVMAGNGADSGGVAGELAHAALMKNRARATKIALVCAAVCVHGLVIGLVASQGLLPPMDIVT